MLEIKTSPFLIKLLKVYPQQNNFEFLNHNITVPILRAFQLQYYLNLASLVAGQQCLATSKGKERVNNKVRFKPRATAKTCQTLIRFCPRIQTLIDSRKYANEQLIKTLIRLKDCTFESLVYHPPFKCLICDVEERKNQPLKLSKNKARNKESA